MSLMSKLLMSTIAATAFLNAGVSDAELIKYFKKFIVNNPSVKVTGVEILDKRTIEGHPGWEVYLTNMKLKHNGKAASAPQTVFVKDGLATSMLVNIKTGTNYAKDMKPKVPAALYNDAHLLFGNKDAKHKILIFSDPQCPFCMEVVPEMMKAAKKYPETFALYYYHLPLMRIHPVSGILTRVMYVAQHKGNSDEVIKLYSLKIDPRETNVDKVLAAVKKQSGFVVTKTEIEKKAVKDAMKSDENAAAKMMVSGTPTVYVDGEWDKARNKYESLIPKKK
ncbi:MAG: DsbA family protein [Campylobacterota bacterium]|nr:DsbA family protein [Campylobacterota bacterium]